MYNNSFVQAMGIVKCFKRVHIKEDYFKDAGKEKNISDYRSTKLSRSKRIRLLTFKPI